MQICVEKCKAVVKVKVFWPKASRSIRRIQPRMIDQVFAKELNILTGARARDHSVKVQN